MARNKGKTNTANRTPKKTRSKTPHVAKGAALSKCARDYAKVLNDPLQAYDEGIKACVPDAMCFPTLKRSFRLRGTFALGTAGNGFITVNPYGPGSNPALTFTTSTTVLASNGALNVATNTSTETLPTAQFGNSAWGGGDNEYRIVAAGVKVGYSGALLDRAGTIAKFHAPHNDDLSDQSITSFNAEPLCVRQPVTAKEVYAKWCPESNGDVSFSVSSNTHQCVIIFVQGEPGLTFTYEAAFHYELMGKVYRAVGGTTTSESDPQGFSAVSNAIIAGQTRPHKSNDSFMRDVADKLLTATSYIYDHGSEFQKAANVLMGAGQTVSMLL